MIRIKVEGLDELISNMGETGSMVKPLVASAINKSVVKIRERAINNAPVAFGGLKGKIRSNVVDLTGTVWSGEKYGIFVELGTRPHFPPVEKLKPWAALKLGNENLAWAVAKKIAREGTDPQPFMQPAVEESLSDIQNNFRILGDQLIKIMGK